MKMTTPHGMELEAALDTLQTRFARLLAEYASCQQQIKQRLTIVEQRKSVEAADPPAASANANGHHLDVATAAS